MHEAGFVHLGNGWAPAWPVAWRASAVALGRLGQYKLSVPVIL